MGAAAPMTHPPIGLRQIGGRFVCLPTQHDTVDVATRLDSLLTGRIKLVDVLVGADTCYLDTTDTTLLKKPTVSLPQIKVPLLEV